MDYVNEHLIFDRDELPVHEGIHWWKIDQLRLGLGRVAQELRIEHTYAIPSKEQPGWFCFGLLQSRRILLNVDSLQVVPKLADRPVVARVSTPVYLPPGAQHRFWVSTTLWLSLQSMDKQLLELPAVRLSDTWFGPNQRKGELCYAAKTHARTAGTLATSNPYKAVTPVTIVNESKEFLVLEKINLPVVHLALYRHDQHFWTTSVKVVRAQTNGELKVIMEAGAPPEASAAVSLQEPRQPVPEGVLFKAKDWLLG